MGERRDEAKAILRAQWSAAIAAVKTLKGVRLITLLFIVGVDAFLIYLSEPWKADRLRAKDLQLPNTGESSGVGNFSYPELVALITPGIAILMAMLAHLLDLFGKGRGIKDVIRRTVGKYPYNLEVEVTSASMTKQSVLVAIAAALAAVIQLYRPGQGQMLGPGHVEAETSYIILVRGLSTFGFAFAILFLLVSMVCYDYASRFRWPTSYKAQLVKRALRLDVVAWYFLLASFILTIALISPRLSVLASITAGLLMWGYYFFTCWGEGDPVGIRGIANVVVKVSDVNKSAAFYEEVLGLENLGGDKTRQRLMVGAWTELVLQKGEVTGSQQLSFTMPEDDLRFAADKLKKNIEAIKKKQSEFTMEPPVVKDANKVQVVTLIDPDGIAIILSALTKKSPE